MARFKLFVEYEGTRYSGWQVQKNTRTVQGEIMQALRHILKTDNFEFHGSGRTDAGVHALEQVAHLDASTQLAPEIIRMKVNDELPADISILEVEKAAGNFHARHDATARSYLYQISRRRTAFGRRYVWWIKDDLNFTAMRETSKLFLGMNDLQSFTDDDPDEKSTKVLIKGIDLKEIGDLILVRIHGSHFIWKLVRRIVGGLAGVGRGALTLGEVQQYIAKKSDQPAHHTAPSSGLFLEQVFYGRDEKPRPLEPVFPVTDFGFRHHRVRK